MGSAVGIPKFAVYVMEWTTDLRVKFIGYYDGREFRGFRDVDEFTAFLLTGPARTVYAHAGGSYDVLHMLGPLIRSDSVMRGFFSGVSLVGLTVSTPNGKVTLADSLFLIQSSVKQLGEWVGKPKLDFDHTVEHDYAVYEPYCRRDCEILYDAISRFEAVVQELGVEMRLTVGATAMALAKHYGGVFPLSGITDRYLTPAYFGGRTEDIRKGFHTDVRCYDINSAYPWAMTQAIPGAFLGASKNRPPPPYFVHAKNIRASGFHGPIPIRTPLGLYYPVGVIPEAILSDVEAALVDDFEPVTYYRFAVNHHLARLVEKLYALRMEGGASSLVYKILANSIYGKFAERAEKDALLVHPSKPPTDGVVMMPGVYRTVQIVNIPHRNIATAAYITALVRAKLYGYMNPNTLYVDTDGFWTTDTLPATSAALGDIKLEKEAKEFHVLQPKVYRYDDTVRAKGYRHLTTAQFDDLARGRKVTLEPTMHRARGMLRRGMLTPSLRDVTKGMHYHKPKRRPDGSSWDFAEIVTED